MPIDIEKLNIEFLTLPENEQIQIQNKWECLYDTPYINFLLKKYNMYHSRVMRMKSKYCYTWHEDPHMRRHIPIITNPGAFMVIEEKVIRMPVGGVYTVDTKKPHTAVNAWREERVHIVGTILDNEQI
jgi:hypothetical protein